MFRIGELSKMKVRGLVLYSILILLILVTPIVFSQEGPDVIVCGDGICDSSEDTTSCPIDCGVGEPPDILEDDILEPEGENDTPPELEGEVQTPSLPESEESLDSEENVLDEIKRITFFSSLAFKIILAIIVLAVIGIILFIIYRKRKMNNQVPEISNQTPKKNLSK